MSDTVTLANIGVALDAITERGCVDHIVAEHAAGRGGWVVTLNLANLRKVCRDASTRDAIGGASLTVADGMPLVWASRWQRTPLPERVAGSNLVSMLSEAAAEHDMSVDLLGGDEGVAEAASRVLTGRYAGLRVVGTSCPPLGFDAEEDAVSRVADEVAAAEPDVVFVALGFPKQERVIARLRSRLPGAWMLGVGISFSFVSGHVRRAPRWMQRAGLEWLHRLAQEPGRLLGRYACDIPFGLSLLARCAVRRGDK